MTTRVANRKLCIEVEGRTFFVGFAPDGSPVNILERRLAKRGKKPAWSACTYWHRSQRLPWVGRQGRRKSVVRAVLEKAGVDTLQIAGH